MRTILGRLAVVLTAVALAGLVRAGDEGEEKVPLDKLPKAVADAVKAKFPKATLVSASKEKEDDKIVYEVQVKNQGYNMDVTVSPEGKILLVEKEIPAKELPKVVADAFEAKYPKATIKLIEEISKDDKVTAYEMQITTTDKKALEVVFDPKGKFVKEESKDKAKDKGEKKDDKNHSRS